MDLTIIIEKDRTYVHCVHTHGKSDSVSEAQATLRLPPAEATELARVQRFGCAESLRHSQALGGFGVWVSSLEIPENKNPSP